MKGILSLTQVLIALEEDMGKWTEEQQKRKVQIREDAYFLIILNLTDIVIRKVSKAKTPTELWALLDKLYGNVLAPNLAYLKASLYAFKFDAARTVDENLDEFLRMIQMVEGTVYVVDEVSHVMIILNPMPDSFQVVKDVFLYTRAVLSNGVLCTALRTRVSELRNSKAKNGVGLYVNPKKNRKNKKKEENSSNENRDKGSNEYSSKKNQGNKFDQSTRKCFYCDKTCHFKKHCVISG